MSRFWSRRRLAQSGSIAVVFAAMPLAACAAPPARPRANLYQCDGCEAVYEADAATLTASAFLAAHDEGEPLVLRGRVLDADGTAPVAGVIVYAHHTNSDGYYANGDSNTVGGRRHGRLRGWVKSDQDGRYEFRTIKPAPYPDRTMPAHIHMMVLEESRRPYWIDEVVFEGEFGVDAAYRRRATNQGGGGVVRLQRLADGTQLAVRDIRLERHPA